MQGKNKTSIGAYPETSEKDILRTRDQFLIKELSEEKGRRLTYCGLAGINAYDVLKWQEYLNDVIIVERPINDEMTKLDFETKVIRRLTPIFNGRVKVVFYDIWDYLVSEDFAACPRMPDVVNLDFCGGFMSQANLDYPKQKEAFQGMFELAKKKGSHFLLLITLLPRDRGKETYKSYLAEHINESLKVGFNADIATQLEANRRFHERNNFTLFKACLPILLSELGKTYHFRVSVRYIRLYTRMIHLAFRCNFVEKKLSISHNPLESIKILNDPIIKILSDGQAARPDFPPRIDVSGIAK